jgi:hypothetical protein
MKQMLKPAVVLFACLALIGCKSMSDFITSVAQQPPPGGSPQSARVNEINSQLASARQQRAELTSDRAIAENQRNESLGEMGKITGFGPKYPGGQLFGEDLSSDPGMMYVMHNNNFTAATKEMNRIDRELESVDQQIANLQSERTRLEKVIQSQNPSPSFAGSGGCFSADTQVLLPGGAFKSIRDLKEGERIVVFNEQSGVLDIRPVIKKFRFYENHYFLLNNDMRVTAMHRFLTKKGWMRAKDLQPGMQLKTPDGWTVLESKELIGVEGDVFNLELEEHHNFFVNANGTSYLVHNTGGGGGK